MQTETKSLRQLKEELQRLTEYFWISRHQKVEDAIQAVRKENEPRVKELEAQIKALQDKRPKPKPRIPENTPQEVIDVCDKYWWGTEELHKYRIHCWNDKAVWTGWASGGYWTTGGFNKSPATFFLISRTKTTRECGRDRPELLHELEGRVSLKQMKELLEKCTK